MRRLICVFLLMLLPLQSFALQSAPAQVNHGFDIQHEIEHLHGINHHHSEDGVAHYDDSGESTQHLSDNACAHTPVALLLDFALQLSFAVPLESSLEMRDYIPHPHLERPQRPPASIG
ncbi:hypothetical protein [Herminiimonas sp. KBW02]|uniref:hypothetical protein n=1 Tax=Herminiimonas sp. KBW02 TaxID=2153363 RepID=UPI000F5A87E8|nr:hypothetical protein [Herminiimonas sp. KBW02]